MADPGRNAPEQRDEIGLSAGLLEALNLAQADLHVLLVARRLVAHTPAQVDGLGAKLTTRVVRFAGLAQPGGRPRATERRARPSGRQRPS